MSPRAVHLPVLVVDAVVFFAVVVVLNDHGHFVTDVRQGREQQQFNRGAVAEH